MTTAGDFLRRFQPSHIDTGREARMPTQSVGIQIARETVGRATQSRFTSQSTNAQLAMRIRFCMAGGAKPAR